MSKAKKRKYVFLFGRVAVVLGGVVWAVLWLSRGQRWDNLTKIFLRIDLWVFAIALGIFAIGQLIVSFRWWLLLRTQSVFIAFWSAVRLHFLGLFYNNFMPSSVGGDLLRAWYVTKHTQQRFKAALSVFVDRAIGLLSTLIIAAFFYLLFLHGKADLISSSRGPAVLGAIVEHRWIFLWVLLAVAAVFCILLLYRPTRLILKKAWNYFREQTRRVFVKFRDAFIIYCKNPGTILIVFGLTVFLQLMTITGFWLLGVNMGITTSVKYYYVCFTLAWILGALPISIGGAVVVEGILVLLLTQFAGVGQEAALALALCQRIIWMLTSLPGSMIHLLGAHLPKHFFVDSSESID